MKTTEQRLENIEQINIEIRITILENSVKVLKTKIKFIEREKKDETINVSFIAE
jgi:hypothetical protein